MKLRTSATVLATVIAVLFAWVGTTQAGTVTSLTITPPQGDNDFSYTWTGDQASVVDGINAPIQYAVSGQTDGDPVFTFVETFTNTSALDWVGYTISTSSPNLLSHPASSTMFATVTPASGSASTFTFSNGEVHPGESVTFNFDINITTANFSFDVINTPVAVPLPGALGLGLAGLLGLGLLRRKAA